MLVPGDMVGLYHVVSRVVDRRMVFGEEEKRHFRRLLLCYAEYSGIEVVAWCVMGNHFHLLLRVPARMQSPPEALPGEEIVRRVGVLYGPEAAQELLRQLGACGAEESRRRLLVQHTRRMGDLGLMMKTLKQRFTQWFNRQHERKGTLWEDRYRSVIVENSDADSSLGGVAKIVAAYIDLNPVRAGIVVDPAEYAWSGYGAHHRGDAGSTRGLAVLWGRDGETAAPLHRALLYDEGHPQRIPESGPLARRAGLLPEHETGNRRLPGRRVDRLPVPMALRKRIRHFTAGAILGSAAFVEEISLELGLWSTGVAAGAARGRKGVVVPGGEWQDSLRSLRGLRVRKIGVPDVPEKDVEHGPGGKEEATVEWE